jgi:hypothetical protein
VFNKFSRKAILEELMNKKELLSAGVLDDSSGSGTDEENPNEDI